MPREHWTSDACGAVDALVESCNRPRASLEQPSAPHLIGRELTPYFGSSEPTLASSPTGKPSKQARKGSPPHQQPARARPAPSSVTAPQAISNTTARKSGKKSGSSSSAASSGASDDDRSAAKQQPMAVSPPRRPASGSGSYLSPYSCPAVFSSPKPDALPAPSNSLLMRACHQASSSVAVVA